MLDTITHLVHQHADDLPTSNLPAERQSELPDALSASVHEALKEHAGETGGLALITQALQGTSGSNALEGLAGRLAGPVSQKLAERLGLSVEQVEDSIRTLLPKLMAGLAQKTQDEKDNSITPESIQTALGGNNRPGPSQGLAGLAGGMLGI